ncbi:L-threonylcarbamoyladenylate synthase [Salibacteraceae bacterium]|jgi:L-threonylcarbamoyladenylate synthase|nr:L-threonylcarbamoyladenylate synthase [Salibacteraceae bacterium]MDB4105591.1 L-threonylcarbamoyladenylate synthase [Salibacteraceae bacterium]MDB9709873.1 L-threonylcarbamoyladenylate synthase [Salibacteraceae bacterium]MDC1220242.1 L-threonylcarbamoyladenylate synthase [bacterium]MDC1304264.1 L-threonylcarbamoyladenylate synthase [Salibacteraceae bacterium]
MTLINNDIRSAASFLKNGELVAIPTETVYGMGANAFNPDAVKSIFAVKNRPFYDPLIIHTDSMDKIDQWGMFIPEILKPLTQKFWPGPLTVLMEKSWMISDVVTAGLPRVAVRIPNHALTLEMLSLCDFPIAAPSANPFGYVSPTTADHVKKHFDGKISMILDGGPCQIGIESTIVGVENGEVVVYRLGGIAIEEIEMEVGEVVIQTSSSKPEAPGMLMKHYAPAKKVTAIESQEELNAIDKKGCAFILFDLNVDDVPEDDIIYLSKASSHDEAAQNFYNALRAWDDKDSIQSLIVQRMPDFGLGRAINDRLRRAVS